MADEIKNWFAHLNAWEWVGLVILLLFLIFLLRNLPDLFRYIKIRSM
jgi:hypothetical protein